MTNNTTFVHLYQPEPIKVSNAEYAENYFNVISNFICIIPAALFFHDKNYYDAIMIFATGFISFLYHLNNNTPQLLDYYPFDQTGIQVADAVLSDILIFQISSYLAFYKNFMLRSSLLFTFLPFELYMAVTSRGKFHLYILFMLVGVFSVFIMHQLHKQNKVRTKYMVIFICGALMNIVGIVMYADLQERYEEKYNVYHAIHHIMAFISIIFYFFVPKNFNFERPFLRNIRSYESFRHIDSTETSDTTEATSQSVEDLDKEISYTPSSDIRHVYRLNTPSTHRIAIERYTFVDAHTRRNSIDLTDLSDQKGDETPTIHYDTRNDVSHPNEIKERRLSPKNLRDDFLHSSSVSEL
jgi:predicted membrane channel-forming protein YqfA (hemolysin III family)